MLITSQQQADETLEKLSQLPLVAIDSEFKWTSTYAPIPALIQIGTADEVFLFDPTKIKNFDSFKKFLEKKTCVKVFHSCSQDLILFFDMCKAITAPIFDTQVAYAFLSRKHQVSYYGLVKEVTGTELAKGSQRSDWLRRPLSPKQVEYAKNDVIWLHRCYTTLVKRLTELHRLEWVQSECALYATAAFYTPTAAQNIYRNIKGVDRLNRQQLAVMRELCAWREETALTLNVRPRKLISEETLFSIACKLPGNAHSLEKCRGISSLTIRYNSRDIIHCVNTALELDDSQKPVLIERRVPSKGEDQMTQRLYECTDALGLKLNIATPLLLTRQNCKKIAHWHCKKLPLDFKFLPSWKVELLEEDIMNILNNA